MASDKNTKKTTGKTTGKTTEKTIGILLFPFVFVALLHFGVNAALHRERIEQNVFPAPIEVAAMKVEAVGKEATQKAADKAEENIPVDETPQMAAKDMDAKNSDAATLDDGDQSAVKTAAQEKEGEADPALAKAMESELGGDLPDGFAAAMARADLDKGKKLARKCKACHNLAEGGKAKLGPPLWGIVGADKARTKGFAYSENMLKADGAWSYADLNTFLKNPRKFIPGTKMLFPGIKKEKDRARVIAYLRGLSSDPVPLP